MPEKFEPLTDAEFWAALGCEMQKVDDPTLEFIQDTTSDTVFHAEPVSFDEPVEPEPVPTWGECFTW